MQTLFCEKTVIVLLHQSQTFAVCSVDKMAEPQDAEIVSNSKGKAAIWRHFGLKKNLKTHTIEPNVAVCMLCKVIVKNSGGTTNMQTHLRRHHPHMCSTTRRYSPMMSSVCAVESSAKSSIGQAPAPTRPLHEMFQQKYSSSSPKATEITSKIARYIVKDLRPFRLVESSEFRGILKSLDPRYQVPSRKPFSGVIIPPTYKNAILAIEKENERDPTNKLKSYII